MFNIGSTSANSMGALYLNNHGGLWAKKNPLIMRGEDRDGVYGKEKQGTTQSHSLLGRSLLQTRKLLLHLLHTLLMLLV